MISQYISQELPPQQQQNYQEIQNKIQNESNEKIEFNQQKNYQNQGSLNSQASVNLAGDSICLSQTYQRPNEREEIEKNAKKVTENFADLSLDPKKQKRNIKIWTKEEDKQLQQYYTSLNGKWEEIAKHIQGRNASQCSQRWRRKFKPEKVRRAWTPEEDKLVLALVDKYNYQWQEIATFMKNYQRSGKQIRERYLNKLNPEINKAAWEKEEDELLIQMYYKIGPKWSEIAKHLNHRPENMVKNRFYTHLKKKNLIPSYNGGSTVNSETYCSEYTSDFHSQQEYDHYEETGEDDHDEDLNYDTDNFSEGKVKQELKEEYDILQENNQHYQNSFQPEKMKNFQTFNPIQARLSHISEENYTNTNTGDDRKSSNKDGFFPDNDSPNQILSTYIQQDGGVSLYPQIISNTMEISQMGQQPDQIFRNIDKSLETDNNPQNNNSSVKFSQNASQNNDQKIFNSIGVSQVLKASNSAISEEYDFQQNQTLQDTDKLFQLQQQQIQLESITPGNNTSKSKQFNSYGFSQLIRNGSRQFSIELDDSQQNQNQEDNNNNTLNRNYSMHVSGGQEVNLHDKNGYKKKISTSTNNSYISQESYQSTTNFLRQKSVEELENMKNSVLQGLASIDLEIVTRRSSDLKKSNYEGMK